MAYQSFIGRPGDSNSGKKLNTLGLPESMEGKSFLDLGCNEGFFCMEAKRRGAATVVGVDISAEYISQAQQRAKDADMDITYICDTWDNLPSGIFDYILIASSLHYAASPVALFDAIYTHLADDGVFVLECGYMAKANPQSRGAAVSRIPRGVGACFYPRRDTLIDEWLRKFTVRHAGESVMQGGDPIPRGIFHCKKWKTTVIFVRGGSGAGKSSLSSRLTFTHNVIETDALFFSWKPDEALFDPRDIKYLHHLQSCGRDITTTWNTIMGDEVIFQHFVDILLKAIILYRETDIVIVEGYVVESLLPIIRPLLENEGLRCWTLFRE